MTVEEMTGEYTSHKPLTQSEWVKARRRMFYQGTIEIELFERLDEKQKFYVNELKKEYKALENNEDTSWINQ